MSSLLIVFFVDTRAHINDCTVGGILEEISIEFESLPSEAQFVALEQAESEVLNQTTKGSLYRFIVGILNGTLKLPSWAKTHKSLLRQSVACDGEAKEGNLLTIKVILSRSPLTPSHM